MTHVPSGLMGCALDAKNSRQKERTRDFIPCIPGQGRVTHTTKKRAGTNLRAYELVSSNPSCSPVHATNDFVFSQSSFVEFLN